MLSRSLGSGFVDRMDASQVIHPTFGRMLLSNGIWRSGGATVEIVSLVYIALSPTRMMSELRKNKKKNTGTEEPPLNIEELHDI